MSKDEVEKYSEVKGQIDRFSQDVIVHQTKLQSLREEYIRLITSLQEETATSNPQEAVEKVKSLEERLLIINDSLRGLFEEFEERIKETD